MQNTANDKHCPELCVQLALVVYPDHMRNILYRSACVTRKRETNGHYYHKRFFKTVDERNEKNAANKNGNGFMRKTITL